MRFFVQSSNIRKKPHRAAKKLKKCTTAPRCCFLLLFLAAVVSCCWHAGFVGQLLFPSLLRAATRFSGTAFGLRPALAKSRRSGQPTHRRSEGTHFLNRLECRPALALPDATLQASGACSCKSPGKPPICNYLIISIIVKSSLPGEAKSMPPGRP